jgi:hypothetical protein
MLDMYAVANGLQLMFMKEEKPPASNSLKVKKKQLKKVTGQEEYEQKLWTILEKSMAIREQLKDKKFKKMQAKNKALEA